MYWRLHSMDVLLAVIRGLLLFLEREDERMTNLFAKSFLALNEQHLAEK
jgi:hypothetical protein